METRKALTAALMAAIMVIGACMLVTSTETDAAGPEITDVTIETSASGNQAIKVTLSERVSYMDYTITGDADRKGSMAPNDGFWAAKLGMGTTNGPLDPDGTYTLSLSTDLGRATCTLDASSFESGSRITVVWSVDGTYHSSKGLDIGTVIENPTIDGVIWEGMTMTSDGTIEIHGSTSPEDGVGHTYWIVDGKILDHADGNDIPLTSSGVYDPRISWTEEVLDGNVFFIGESPISEDVGTDVVVGIVRTTSSVAYVSVNSLTSGTTVPSGEITLWYTYQDGYITHGQFQFPNNVKERMTPAHVPDNNVVMFDLGADIGDEFDRIFSIDATFTSSDGSVSSSSDSKVFKPKRV